MRNHQRAARADELVEVDAFARQHRTTAPLAQELRQLRFRMQRRREVLRHRAVGFTVLGFLFALKNEFHLVHHFLLTLKLRLHEAEVHHVHAHGGMNPFRMGFEVAVLFALQYHVAHTFFFLCFWFWLMANGQWRCHRPQPKLF